MSLIRTIFTASVICGLTATTTTSIIAGSVQDTIFTFFAVSQTNEGVLIAFTVKGGVTCQGVKITRSVDGVSFKEIHEIPGVCGNANFDESYHYTDKSPVPNRINYYRIDLGTLGIFSDILSVHYVGYNDEGYNVLPNPCTDDCIIYFSNENSELHQYVIFSSSGDLVTTGETTGRSIEIDETSLTPGVFFFKVYRNSEPRFTGRLLHLSQE